MLERYFVAPVAGSGLACLCGRAASPPSPPAPAPESVSDTRTNAPTPVTGIEQMPVVLIYPFDVQTGVDPQIGIAIAQILAQEMAAAGGISVLPCRKA